MNASRLGIQNTGGFTAGEYCWYQWWQAEAFNWGTGRMVAGGGGGGRRRGGGGVGGAGRWESRACNGNGMVVR